MSLTTKAYLVGGGNGSLAAAFMMRDGDVVFTIELSVRAAQMAVYGLRGIQREIPPVTPHDKPLQTQLDALIKALV